MSYLILSAKHSPFNGLATWWGPDRCGYYTDLEKAGRYTLAEATDICRHHPKLPPASFAIEEETQLNNRGLDEVTWKQACDWFIPAGQPVQQDGGRAPIVIGEAP